MTKKEQETLQRLKWDLALAKAFRFTDIVEPDVPIPDWNSLSTGFLHGGSGSSWPRVEPACSSSTSHNFGRNDKTSSQGARRLYSTKLLALKALRNALEQRFAGELANIDIQIAAEQGTDGTEGE